MEQSLFDVSNSLQPIASENPNYEDKILQENESCVEEAMDIITQDYQIENMESDDFTNCENQMDISEENPDVEMDDKEESQDIEQMTQLIECLWIKMTKFRNELQLYSFDSRHNDICTQTLIELYETLSTVLEHESIFNDFVKKVETFPLIIKENVLLFLIGMANNGDIDVMIQDWSMSVHRFSRSFREVYNDFVTILSKIQSMTNTKFRM